MSRSEERKNTSFGKDSRTCTPAPKMHVVIGSSLHACNNAPRCCLRACEEHFSCVCWTVSRLARQPSCWECHRERSRLDWRALEQRFGGTCDQRLRQDRAAPSGPTDSLNCCARGFPGLPCVSEQWMALLVLVLLRLFGFRWAPQTIDPLYRCSELCFSPRARVVRVPPRT
jgi:hypothetical protein